MIKTISYSGGKYSIYNEDELKHDFDLAEKFYDMLWFDEAIESYYKLAQKNYPPALYKLGRVYFFGEGIDVCDHAAFDMFKRASELGYVPAHTMLGRCYMEGIGTEKKPRKAYSLFLKGAKAGDLNAMIGVCTCCDFGIGRRSDFAAAVPWIKKLAAANISYAVLQLARAYFLGLRGLNRDKDKAIELFTKSAELGNAEAKCQLGDMYRHGEGVKKDLRKSYILLMDAYKNDCDEALVPLAEAYEMGLGVEKSPTKAAYIYEIAANRNVPAGQKRYADYLYEGKYVEKNIDLAHQYYKEAAEQDNHMAKIKLKQLFNEDLF